MISYKNAKPLPNSKPRTIEDGLEEGDIIVSTNNQRKVLGICGQVILISVSNKFNRAAGSFTLSELIDNSYQLVQPESDPKSQDLVHLTIQDISEGKGKGIDPKLLRIKE
jgi:hypothetical protein